MGLTKLLEEKAALEAEIARLQAQGKAEGLAKVRQVMADHGLSVADVFGAAAGTGAGSGGKAERESKPRGPVAAKYRDSATGKAWSGRGLKPTWLREAVAGGRALEEFAV